VTDVPPEPAPDAQEDMLFANPDEMLRYLSSEGVKFIDVRFCDLLGVMQHFTVPVEAFDESTVTEGMAFDGSSIRGFQQIHESDMLLLPDVATAFIDPFRAAKTLALNFFIHDPFTREPYSRDPRHVAKKAEAYLAASGIADTAYFGPEAEFYVFDSIRYDTGPQQAFYAIDSVEGAWNTGRDEPGGNLGYKTAYKGGYFPVPPTDHFADLRNDMVAHLTNAGLLVERAHHEVGTAGQAEINYRFSTLLHSADQTQLFKYIVKNTAWAHGKTATFMPKPIFGDNGSGMHTHQSLFNGGEPLFYDETGYAGLSDIARWYIGGLLEHAPSLLAFTNPTVNSYRRLVPGFEAPVNLVYSQRNRSACARIPVTGTAARAKRVEFRVPDPSANPYLAFAAMLMAGLDGIRNKMEPPEPIDKDLYDLPPDDYANVRKTPGSLPDVLAALHADHDYLLEGGVFTADLIETWIEWKNANEIDPVRLRPTPHEFAMYYDV
jgi:glutamine synthetase